MKIRLGLLSACAISVQLFAGFASAKDIYIAQNATGGATGADCSNARPASFFNTASNWGTGASQIGAGTVVHLCGTLTVGANSTALSFQGNGTSGNPITLLFEPNAVVQAPYFAPSVGGANACGGGICGQGRSFIVIDGGANGILRNTANGTTLANHQSTLGVDIHNCNNCVVQNLSISNIYVRSSATDNAIDETQMKCIEFNGSNIQIKGNNIDSAGWCLFDAYKNGDTNIDISNNKLIRFAHAIMFATGAANSATNISVHDNEFLGPGTMWDGPGCPFHQDGIHVFGVSGSSIDNFYFYNNYFHGDWGQCPTGWVFIEAAGAGTPANMNNSYWWNNVGVVNSTGQVQNTNGWFNVSSGNSGVQEFFNNTFVGPNATDATWCLQLQNLSNVVVKNNLFNSCGNPISVDAAGAKSIDYNFYGTSCQNGNNCFVLNGSFTGSFSAWKSACGCDSHSLQTNSPQVAADGTPLAGSPAVNAGTNLMSLATGGLAMLAFDTTRGNTRTAVARSGSGSWTMGGYSTTGGGTAIPSAPTSLRIVPLF